MKPPTDKRVITAHQCAHCGMITPFGQMLAHYGLDGLCLTRKPPLVTATRLLTIEEIEKLITDNPKNVEKTLLSFSEDSR